MAGFYWTLKITTTSHALICLARCNPLQHAVIYYISIIAHQSFSLLLFYFLLHPILLLLLSKVIFKQALTLRCKSFTDDERQIKNYLLPATPRALFVNFYQRHNICLFYLIMNHPEGCSMQIVYLTY